MREPALGAGSVHGMGVGRGVEVSAAVGLAVAIGVAEAVGVGENGRCRQRVALSNKPRENAYALQSAARGM